jgi:hypothetical protein
MARAKFEKASLRLSGWGALALGFGTLVAGGAQAAASAPGVGTTPSRPDAADEVVIRTEGEKIYVSQGGKAFEELSLRDTPEAAHLRKLLGDAGAATGPVTLPAGSFVVANGGSGVSGTKPSGKKPKKKKSGNA